MSLEIKKTGTKGRGYLRGATLCYTKIQSSVNKYQSTTEKEYSVDAIVSEDIADEWIENFPKNGVRAIKTSEFEAKYKITPPFPGEKKQYMLKLKADAMFRADCAEYSAGDMVPHSFVSRPKVFIPAEGGVEDVTATTLVGNGSVGDISFNITTNDYGTFPQLTGVLVTSLVEYESRGGAFGNVVNKQEPDEPTPPKKSKQEEPQYDERNPPPADFDDFDEDTEPF